VAAASFVLFVKVRTMALLSGGQLAGFCDWRRESHMIQVATIFYARAVTSRSHLTHLKPYHFRCARALHNVASTRALLVTWPLLCLVDSISDSLISGILTDERVSDDGNFDYW